MNRGVVVLGMLAGCHMDDRLSYAWDDRRVLCSEAVDDMTQSLNWGRVEDEMAQKLGFSVKTHRLQITGSCEQLKKLGSCKRKSATCK